MPTPQIRFSLFYYNIKQKYLQVRLFDIYAINCITDKNAPFIVLYIILDNLIKSNITIHNFFICDSVVVKHILHKHRYKVKSMSSIMPDTDFSLKFFT